MFSRYQENKWKNIWRIFKYKSKIWSPKVDVLISIWLHELKLKHSSAPINKWRKIWKSSFSGKVGLLNYPSNKWYRKLFKQINIPIESEISTGKMLILDTYIPKLATSNGYKQGDDFAPNFQLDKQPVTTSTMQQCDWYKGINSSGPGINLNFRFILIVLIFIILPSEYIG